MLEPADISRDGDTRPVTLDVIRPDDIVIAVFGTTGAGKSSFIADCTKDRLPYVGHGLSSCTTHVSIHTMQMLGRTVHLIDTPGFNDTLRSDAETFQELAYWLNAADNRKFQLSGVIFLHRITDIRFYTSTRRALEIFKAICGKNSFCGAVVATTMWNQIATDEMEKVKDRHAQLKVKLSADLLASGGGLVPVSAAEVDPLNIVRHMVRKDLRLDLAFQKELRRHGCLLCQKAAGKIVYEYSFTSFEAMSNAMHSSKRETATVLVSLRATRAQTQLAWEKRIEHENREFQRVMQQYREHLQLRDRETDNSASAQSLTALEKPSESLKRLEDKGCDASFTSSARLESELEGLKRQHDAILLRRRRKLDQKHWAHGRGTQTLSVVGTGLAVGQLVAAMACNVM